MLATPLQKVFMGVEMLISANAVGFTVIFTGALVDTQLEGMVASLLYQVVVDMPDVKFKVPEVSPIMLE